MQLFPQSILGTHHTEEGEGRWTVAIPDPVRDYNKYMGGVGLSDALIQYYSVRGKAVKWYKTFSYHFVAIAIVNTFILQKQVTVGRGDTPMTQEIQGNLDEGAC